jgi:hypothetical protein
MGVVGGAGVTTQGPDGRHVVALALMTGAGQIQILLDPDHAVAFVDQLSTAVKAATKQAKRAKLGIMLATPDMVGDLGVPRPGTNGQPSGVIRPRSGP